MSKEPAFREPRRNREADCTGIHWGNGINGRGPKTDEKWNGKRTVWEVSGI